MITVTNLNDSGAGSLRAAIAAAAVGEEITFSVTGTITLTTNELKIVQGVIITGPGSGSLTISGGGNWRVFNFFTGVITVSGLTVENGVGVDSGGSIVGLGGGIHAEATVKLDDVIIQNCTSPNDGGGLYNTSTVTMTNCTVTGCDAAAGSGGGIWNSGTCTSVYTTITGCTATSNGGGIWNEGTFNHVRSSVSGCTTSVDNGGGVANTGTYLPTDVSISGNDAFSNGDGLWNQFGSVTLVRCTVSNNDGLNIFNASGTMTMINCTVSGDGSTNAGIDNNGGSALDIKNSTITHTTFGIGNDPGSFLTLYNTILAGNTSGDYSGNTADVTSNGHNILGVDIVQPITDGPGDIRVLTYAALIIGPLQDNGGPTFTHALLPGSPALDVGDNTNAPITDQRGFSRIVATTIDIGAFEAQVVGCFSFTGTLPSWLTLNDQCFTVTPNTFRASTKAAANAQAQAALNAFVAESIASGDLVCGTGPVPPTVACPVFKSEFNPWGLGVTSNWGTAGGPNANWNFFTSNSGAGMRVGIFDSSDTLLLELFPYLTSYATSFSGCVYSASRNRLYACAVKAGVSYIKKFGGSSLLDLGDISINATIPATQEMKITHIPLTEKIVISAIGGMLVFDITTETVLFATTAGDEDVKDVAWSQGVLRYFAPTEQVSPPEVKVRNALLTIVDTIVLTGFRHPGGCVYNVAADKVILFAQRDTVPFLNVVLVIDPNTLTITSVLDCVSNNNMPNSINQDAELGLVYGQCDETLIVYDATTNTILCEVNTSVLQTINQIGVNAHSHLFYIVPGTGASFISKYGQPV